MDRPILDAEWECYESVNRIQRNKHRESSRRPTASEAGIYTSPVADLNHSGLEIDAAMDSWIALKTMNSIFVCIAIPPTIDI